MQQNFVLRWVRDESVYDVWERLGELGLDETGPREITDVVSCPGTDSCKLGITSSMGLNQAVQERLEAMQITDPLTKRIHVKMSRLPERLRPAPHRQHRLLPAPRSRSASARSPPTSPTSRATTRAARSSTATASRRGCRPSASPTRSSAGCASTSPSADDGEEFNAFVERVGTDPFEAQVKDLAMPVEFSLETLDQFIDWSRSEPYKVERGEGECAV